MTSEMTKDLSGKVYVVTGANSGIGFSAVSNFASRGARVVMVCRNIDLGLEALDKIRNKTNNNGLELFIADFSSLTSVSMVAKKILEKYPRIDVLCNNAGGANGTRRITAEGFETTFVVNHLAGFLLTQKLLPALERAAEVHSARVVFTSSYGHANSPLDFDDLNLEHGYTTLKAYGRSKLMNLLTARELQQRFGDKNIVSSSFHPGMVRTPIWRKGGLVAVLLSFVLYPFMRNVENGAKTFIWLASSEDDTAKYPNGDYYFDRKLGSAAPFATKEAAEQLWLISKELTQPFI
jgi:NAD(P)-dependent dehydrogenase (short-subunit alcohol dehydrogenase family)